MVSKRSMSRCRYDIEHTGMCGHCTMFCASIRCDLLLDVHVASLVFANIFDLNGIVQILLQSSGYPRSFYAGCLTNDVLQFFGSRYN